MPVRIAINGFGRIGRLVLRAGYKNKDVQFVAVNDLADAKTIAHLLKYDSVHGTLPAQVTCDANSITVDSSPVKVFSKRDPRRFPGAIWGLMSSWREVFLQTATMRKSILKPAPKKWLFQPQPKGRMSLLFLG